MYQTKQELINNFKPHRKYKYLVIAQSNGGLTDYGSLNSISTQGKYCPFGECNTFARAKEIAEISNSLGGRVSTYFVYNKKEQRVALMIDGVHTQKNAN